VPGTGAACASGIVRFRVLIVARQRRPGLVFRRLADGVASHPDVHVRRRPAVVLQPLWRDQHQLDAGVVTVAITVGANHASSVERVIIQLLAACIGAGIVALSILLTYRYAGRLSRRIGHTDMMVVVRLSAFIMVYIGVGITWNGVKSLLAEVGVVR
jgi:hypothetical protein